MSHTTMSPYIGIQSKPQDVVLEVGLSFMVWTKAKDSPLPIRHCLVRVSGSKLEWPLDRQGRSTDCGLKCLNHTFPRPLGRKRANEWLHQTRIVRSNRGASQQQQPHKSNSSGRVKPLTPLLARRKRRPSLRSVSRFWFTPGCDARESMLYKATPQRPCFDHQPQDFSLQQKPWSFAS